jgi:hypothetical protein
MPRYHFNVVLGDKLIGDQVGQTCPDLEAAYHRASSIAREMLGSPRVYGVRGRVLHRSRRARDCHDAILREREASSIAAVLE